MEDRRIGGRRERSGLRGRSIRSRRDLERSFVIEHRIVEWTQFRHRTTRSESAGASRKQKHQRSHHGSKIHPVIPRRWYGEIRFQLARRERIRCPKSRRSENAWTFQATFQQKVISA